MVQASFQAGTDNSLGESSQLIDLGGQETVEESKTAGANVPDDGLVVNENGFQITSTFEDADEANNNFARFRKMDKEAYESKQREIEN